MIVPVEGAGTVFYVLTVAARIAVERELPAVFGRKRLEKRLREFRDHYVICGHGSMGKIISSDLKGKEMRTAHDTLIAIGEASKLKSSEICERRSGRTYLSSLLSKIIS